MRIPQSPPCGCRGYLAWVLFPFRKLENSPERSFCTVSKLPKTYKLLLNRAHWCLQFISSFINLKPHQQEKTAFMGNRETLTFGHAPLCFVLVYESSGLVRGHLKSDLNATQLRLPHAIEKHFRWGSFAWHLSVEIFCLGAVAWELFLDTFDFEPLSWNSSFCNFRLGSIA